MKISILTLFPTMFVGPLSESILKRAIEKGTVTIDLINIRDSARDKYKSVDDHPYGGGPGMILRVDIVDLALSNVKGRIVAPLDGTMARRRQMSSEKTKTVLLDPRGELYSQQKAHKYAHLDHLILICGHYEGVDERVISLVDESTSIGEYVLTGGELPAMVIVDSVVRLIPGVLKKEATSSESFSLPSSSLITHHSSLTLEYPQYTRPELYKGKRVPKVLLSGNHGAITAWRKDHTTVRRDPASRRLRLGSAPETLTRKNPDI